MDFWQRDNTTKCKKSRQTLSIGDILSNWLAVLNCLSFGFRADFCAFFYLPAFI